MAQTPLLPRGLVAIATLIALPLALIAPAGTANAAGFVVTSTEDAADAHLGDGACATATGACTLRAAIQEANTLPGADAITLPTGTYTLALAGPLEQVIGEDAAATGDLDIAGDLTITGAGTTSTIVDGNGAGGSEFDFGADRVFDIHGATVTLNGVTVRNAGHVTASQFGEIPPVQGGGIRNDGALTLTDSVVSGNAAFDRRAGGSGGGIYNTGTLSLVHSTVSANVAAFPGGIYNGGTLVLTDSAVSSNESREPDFFGDFRGAGIYNLDTLTVTGSTIADNSGPSGILNDGTGTVSRSTVEGNRGGISNSGTLVLADIVVRDNSVDGVGGGISNAGHMTLTGSVISGNSARERGFRGVLSGGTGGGIYISSGGTLSVTNSTLSGNTADFAGGALDVRGALSLQNVTIADNTRATSDEECGSAGLGCGVAGLAINAPANLVTARNTLVAGNVVSGGGASDCSGTLTSQGHNLIQDPDGCTLVGTASGNLLGVDPLLGPLQDNGGPTVTQALQPGSPAIDAGDNTGCPPVDQRGVARSQDGDGDGVPVCDIGAYERQGVAAVATVPIDVKPGNPTSFVNPHSDGLLAVAILSTPGLDARTIDATSLCFGADPAAHACTAPKDGGRVQDANHDGRPDLVLQFATERTGIEAGDTQACLTGKTTAGGAIRGCDAIRTVPPAPPPARVAPRPHAGRAGASNGRAPLGGSRG